MLLAQGLAVVLLMGSSVGAATGVMALGGARSLVRVAVAANFAATHQKLVREFEADGHRS